MGRKRKPLRMRIIEGNPGKRPLNVGDEPQPNISENVPKPPSCLSSEAKKEWANIAPKLHRIGLLTEIDIPALTMYCAAYARWVESEREIKTNGITQTVNGVITKSPFLSISRQNARLACKFLNEFGMIPSASLRRRLKE